MRKRENPCGDCVNGYCDMNCGPALPAVEAKPISPLRVRGGTLEEFKAACGAPAPIPSTLTVFIKYSVNGNIRKWDTVPFEGGEKVEARILLPGRSRQ